jgi:hypothetical protein
MSLIEQYAVTHAQAIYGASSAMIAHHILPHVILSRAESVIDYGCGRSRLPDIISHYAPCTRYDPAIPEYAALPADKCFDLAVCVDVMEHIPEEEIDRAIRRISELSINAVFVIDTREAKHVLPNGQNAHVTVRPAEWWRQRLLLHYDWIEQFDIRQKSNIAFRTWSFSRGEMLLIRIMTFWFGAQKRLGLL